MDKKYKSVQMSKGKKYESRPDKNWKTKEEAEIVDALVEDQQDLNSNK